MKRFIMMTALSLGLIASAHAASVLDVVETAGDYYTITARDQDNASQQYWQAKVDITSGSIFMFKDMTDAGDGAGDHTDYLGGGEGYSRKTSLLWFDGRGGNVLSASGSVAGLSDRMSFSYDANSFTITYTEDASSTGFFHNSYGTTTPGDMLTTISVTINAPDADGTAWDWSKSHYINTDFAQSGKVLASDWVCSNVFTGYASYDEEESIADGAWDPNDPKSFGRYTVVENELGLTEGRQIILDWQESADEAGLTRGGTVGLDDWAGRDVIEYAAPFSYSTVLLAGETYTQSGQLIIDIAVPEPATLSMLALGSLALLRRRK